MTPDYFVTMTYICYHHKIIPENYFALMVDGQLVYNGRCVEAPRPPHIELVECTPQSSTRWELKKYGPVWGSLRHYHVTDSGETKESCIAQVCYPAVVLLMVSLLFVVDSAALIIGAC